MKLKQACYDPAFSRMGWKRFAPIGILYTLVLVVLTLANVNAGQNMHSNAVMGLWQFYQLTTVLQFGYAFVLVQLLLGDLYTPRLCFAIHALPVTRGGWFGTQVIQGILTAIPGILLSGALMAASVTRFRFLIPLWMGIAALQFLFFFGLALLCGVGAGNRMGMAVLYGMANFFGVVLSWARLKIFAPLTYGMYIPDTEVILCPISKLLHAEVFRTEYQSMVDVSQLRDGPTAFFNSSEITKVQLVPQSIWTNVLFAALGILAIFLAMKLLNRRKPECAGDLLAFRVTEPVILVLCTLSAGVVFHAVSYLFDWSLGYLMLALGLVLGYYICLMLLKRQVNVLTGRSFLPLAAMVCLTVLALGVTGLDLFGTAERMPEAEKVQKVELRVPFGYHDTFTAETPEDIQKVLTLHGDMLEEHRATEAQRPFLERIFGNEEAYREYPKEDGTTERTGQMFLTYTLTDGSTLCRSYEFHESIPNLAILRDIFSQPEYVFSDFDMDIFSEQDVRDLLKDTEFIQLVCWHGIADEYGYSTDKTLRIPKEEWNSLLDAMLEDGKNGCMGQTGVLHPDQNYFDYVSIYYPSNAFKGLDSHSVSVYGDSVNTLTWLIDHGYHDEISG